MNKRATLSSSRREPNATSRVTNGSDSPTIVKVKKRLSRQEARTVDKWIQQIFVPMESGAKYSWTPECHWNVLVYSGTELVSYLKLVERSCLIDDVFVKAAGLGCVMTPSDKRKQGFARLSLMRVGRIIFNEVKAQIGLLLCPPELVAFYQRYGWQEVRCAVKFQQPSKTEIWPYSAMLLTKHGERRRPKSIDLCGLPW